MVGRSRLLAPTMPLLDSTDSRPLHFVGIAGAGMSALAELMARRGARVTGCDANIAGTDDLQRLGIVVQEGHDVIHIAGARALVVTSAMPKDHPEIARARAHGIPVIRRAEALGEAVSGGTLVGIAGTHGKTTTTVMTTEALAAAGLEPTGLAGGRVGAWQGNLRFGGERVFVVESDEYDRSFLALTPTIAVVTNIEADHLDIYRDLDDILGAFATFASPARYVVLCADDDGAASLRISSSAEVVRYSVDAGDGRGPSKDARLVASKLDLTGGAAQYDVAYDGEHLGRVKLRVPGVHNVRNSLAAIASGLLLGAPLEKLAEGLALFTGVERRFQRLGEHRGITVVDDYAHHPTEIAATLRAARDTFPGRRVLAAFQPHLFTRTRDFADAFGEALAHADEIFLTDIYPAREKPIEGVTADLVANAAQLHGTPVFWRGTRDRLAEALSHAVREGDVVLTIGAGDITKTGPELLARLTLAD
jgi:UDP-N-acetylmuramate--alanine ligase